MKWTQINESMIQDRESTFNTEDISDLDASFAISEAISFAAEMKYRAKGLVQDICDFNTKAEEMEYTCQQYIEESFMVGGIIAAIIGLIILALKTVSSSMKAMGKGMGTSIDRVLSTKKSVESLEEKISKLDAKAYKGGNIDIAIPDMSVLHWLLESHNPMEYIFTRFISVNGKKSSIEDIIKEVADASDIDQLETNTQNIKSVHDMLEGTLKTIGSGKKGPVGIITGTVLNEKDGGMHKAGVRLVRDTHIEVSAARDVEELIKNLKSFISSSKTKKIDPRTFINELVKDEAYNDIMAFTTKNMISTTENLMNRGVKRVDELIKKLEALKNTAGKAKDKAFENSEKNKDTIGKLNKIQAYAVELQTSLNELVSGYCIPAFKLFDAGLYNLAKAIKEIEVAYSRFAGDTSNPKDKFDGDKYMKDKETEAKQFMDDLADPKKKTVKF